MGVAGLGKAGVDRLGLVGLGQAGMGGARQGRETDGWSHSGSTPGRRDAASSVGAASRDRQTQARGYRSTAKSVTPKSKETTVDIQFVLLGVSPILCHNPQMVDPQFEINRQIKALTSKKKKTDEDLAEIERLEWFGGIYTGVVNGKPMVTQPTSKVRKCLIGAARINKMGKQIERAITMTDLNTPLIYDGSDRVTDLQAELQRLQASRDFNSRLSVGVGGKRVMRVRPQFSPWALIVEAVFLDDAGLNFDELERIVELAGKAERIGDNRINGYGAFRGAVIKGNRKITPTIAGVNKFFDDLDASEAA